MAMTVDEIIELVGNENLGDHMMIKCRGCERIVTQCRCTKPNKTVYYVETCDHCLDANSGN